MTEQGMAGGVNGPPGGGTRHSGPSTAPAAYFLSDYGTVDEFVGVVHAVLHRLAPTLRVIDLSHQVPAFDVAAGAAMLVRSGPSLGAGVVLAVVDPGVGTDRRAVALEVPHGGPRWLVGPDNGLLLPLAASLGGVLTAVVLDPVRAGWPAAAGTFDGRDVFAPAAAHLAAGGGAHRIGDTIDPATLRPLPGRAGAGRRPGGPVPGGPVLRARVTWIDGFGNAQLTADPDALAALGVPLGGTALVTVLPGSDGGAGGEGGRFTARRVGAFGRLAPGELGLLDDANGQVSLVLDRASAARALALEGSGAIVHISAATAGWGPAVGDPAPEA